MKNLGNVCINKCDGKENCDLNTECRQYKPQPGEIAGINNRKYTCTDMITRTIADNPEDIYIIGCSNKDKCLKDYYKGVVIVNTSDELNGGKKIKFVYKNKSKKKGGNYHYARKYKPSSKMGISGWGHKPGSTAVTQLDNAGKKIWDPTMADWKYSGNIYNEVCPCFCIKNKDLNLEHQDIEIDK